MFTHSNNVEWKQTHHTVPLLVIYDNNSKKTETINLINKTSEECASILLKRGFRKSSFTEFFKTMVNLQNKF